MIIRNVLGLLATTVLLAASGFANAAAIYQFRGVIDGVDGELPIHIGDEVFGQVLYAPETARLFPDLAVVDNAGSLTMHIGEWLVGSPTFYYSGSELGVCETCGFSDITVPNATNVSFEEMWIFPFIDLNDIEFPPASLDPASMPLRLHAYWWIFRFDEGEYYIEESIIGATITEWRELRPTAVPEPTTLALLGLGLVGMGYARRRKSH